MKWHFFAIGMAAVIAAIVAGFELYNQIQLAEWAHRFDALNH